jgi:hypothetical protein
MPKKSFILVNGDGKGSWLVVNTKHIVKMDYAKKKKYWYLKLSDGERIKLRGGYEDAFKKLGVHCCCE